MRISINIPDSLEKKIKRHIKHKKKKFSNFLIEAIENHINQNNIPEDDLIIFVEKHGRGGNGLNLLKEMRKKSDRF